MLSFLVNRTLRLPHDIESSPPARKQGRLGNNGTIFDMGPIVGIQIQSGGLDYPRPEVTGNSRTNRPLTALGNTSAVCPRCPFRTILPRGLQLTAAHREEGRWPPYSARRDHSGNFDANKSHHSEITCLSPKPDPTVAGVASCQQIAIRLTIKIHEAACIRNLGPSSACSRSVQAYLLKPKTFPRLRNIKEAQSLWVPGRSSKNPDRQFQSKQPMALKP